jgi:tellurite resistance protein TehA-like permease
MTTEYLEQQLEKWQRVSLLFLGVGLMMAVSTFGIVGEYSFSYGWVMAWVVLQLGTIPTGLLMLFSKDWRRLPLMQRLTTAFGFLGAGWLGWLAIGFRVASESSLAFAATLLPGAILALIYLLSRRTQIRSSEEIFP